MPPHFATGSGIVVDKWNRQTRQVDLLIYDRRRMPPIFEEHGHGIFPIDAVLRLIEVKSFLDRPALEQLARLVDSVNPANADGLKVAAPGNLDNGHLYYPAVGIFGYSTANTDPQVLIASVDGLAGLNVSICIAERGFGFFGDNGFDYTPSNAVCTNVRRFLVSMLDAIETTAASRKPFSAAEWLNASTT